MDRAAEQTHPRRPPVTPVRSDAPTELREPALEDLEALAGGEPRPCVTIYLPMPAAFPERMQNALRYGQAVAHAADRLGGEGVPTADVSAWADRLTELDHDLRDTPESFRGLAVFLDEAGVRAFRLVAPPRERVYVADGFALRELARQVALLQIDKQDAPKREQVIVELDRILQAARRGRVRVLWTLAGASVQGRIDPETGRVVSAENRDGDVLDALAARVLNADGGLRVVSSLEMPAPVSAAAELF